MDAEEEDDSSESVDPSDGEDNISVEPKKKKTKERRAGRDQVQQARQTNTLKRNGDHVDVAPDLLPP